MYDCLENYGKKYASSVIKEAEEAKKKLKVAETQIKKANVRTEKEAFRADKEASRADKEAFRANKAESALKKVSENQENLRMTQLFDNIKNLMTSLKLTSEQAMNALMVKETDRTTLKAMFI